MRINYVYIYPVYMCVFECMFVCVYAYDTSERKDKLWDSSMRLSWGPFLYFHLANWIPLPECTMRTSNLTHQLISVLTLNLSSATSLLKSLWLWLLPPHLTQAHLTHNDSTSEISLKVSLSPWPSPLQSSLNAFLSFGPLAQFYHLLSPFSTPKSQAILLSLLVFQDLIILSLPDTYVMSSKFLG